MDLDWCIVCDKHTSGGIYCSQACRNKDTPSDLKGKPPIVPGPLDKKRLAMPMTNSFNRNNFYEYDDTDEEETSPNDHRYGNVVGFNNGSRQTDLYVSYGALTNHSTLNFANPNKKKFLSRQQYLYHPARQEARVF